ncbi:MAG: TIGR04255 family protein [Acidobacteria bacterium]|nr:TIGR04255 family protein [Acidobacteriota bacterium]MCA1640027.1 TIGR04255 family protein [Acidobacteriota bacterium]
MKNKTSNKALARKEYKSSPIIEALVEVHFSQTKTDFTVWANFNNKLKKSYPIVEELLIPKTELRIAQDRKTGEGRFSQEKLLRFYKKDRTQLVQASKDFVSVNKLKPYSGYEKFIVDAETVLKNYIDLTSPKLINRIGMRYINQIIIPETSVELSDYFRYIPQIPDEVTKGISSVLLEIQFAPRNSQHQVMTSLRSDVSSIEGTTVFFLDIYDILPVNNEVNISVILNSLNEAHENIERVFEGFITDKARKLFGVVKNNDK